MLYMFSILRSNILKYDIKAVTKQVIGLNG